MQHTFSPIDGSLIVERTLATTQEIEQSLASAAIAQQAWREISLTERQRILSTAIELFSAQQDEIAQEITLQMGRPISQSPGEVNGFVERAQTMLELAPHALTDISFPDTKNSKRFIRREPLGLIAIIAPWNYPYLTAVNTLIPALMAGNAVILKHSKHTPLCAERLTSIFTKAGLPAGVFSHLHLSHENTSSLIQDPRIQFVAFTGSVRGGREIVTSLSNTFTGCGLELGGKDPAYVRTDVNLPQAIESLVDGAFFNSGQSCCGIERIYVHEKLFDDFVDGFVDLVRQYRLGDPMQADTTLGPMITAQAADGVRTQIQAALECGARALLSEPSSGLDKPGSAYLSPQVLVSVSHDMAVMREESFGPVVGIMAVKDDAQAIQLMNDSDYGLTASLWTRDTDIAIQLGKRIETGTVFMNRCDYLDPLLTWTGVKNTGRGQSLSELGYHQLTRVKSFNLST